MDYAPPTYSQAPAADYSPTLSSVTIPCSPSSKRNRAADQCTPGCSKGGCPQTCTSIAETCSSSTLPHGPDVWIASQRASLARIFHALDQARASRAHQIGFHDQRGKAANKPTLGKMEANATPLEFRDELLLLAMMATPNE